MMKDNEYLPIGSVVLLKNAKKRIMITGFCPLVTEEIDGQKKEIKYDYNGCLFPEGILSSDQILFFNNSQIENIYFKGFVDLETQRFHEELNNV